MTRLSPLILALALGCADADHGPSPDAVCPFVQTMMDLGVTSENCVPSCAGGTDGLNGYDGFGVFTCRVKGRVIEVRTDAACYNSPGDYPMFDLNEGCPEVWRVKKWRE